MTAPSQGGRGGARVALLVGVLAAVVVVYLTSRAEPTPPFSIESSSSDGYRALALLARGDGASVEAVDGGALAAGELGADAVIVPLPSRLGPEGRRGLTELARGGATVVLGERFGGDDTEAAFLDAIGVPHRVLADTEAFPVPPRTCSVAALEGLGTIDAAFSVPIPVLEGERSCYGDGTEALIVERDEGAGRVVTLADPLLWANARLQPAKEEGGEPLDNAATFLALSGAGPGQRLVFVDPSPAPGAAPTGARDPLELLPLPVKLALAQALVALLFFLWWRGRRLGRPVAEPLPVEIAASELVGAVGDLLRRRGSASRAAASLRIDTHQLLARRLGLPPGAPPDALVQRISERTGRAPAEVASVLLDPTAGGSQVNDSEALLRLAHQLDTIRQEVLDDQPVR